MELKLPLDFERLPEFWQLTEKLRELAAVRTATGGGAAPTEEEIRDTAILLWVRLWVVLGYLARMTNRPGWLNAAGERQLNGAFKQFGDETPAVLVLTAGSLLHQGEDGYYCDLFTATNKHLAGNFLTPAERGNRRSLPARSKNAIAQEALQQSQLLPPEIYKTRDGRPMDPRQVSRSMVLIITLDRCLKRPSPRHRGDFTQGMIADACAVVESEAAPTLPKFYEWLAERFDHPATPKSAEDILRTWETIFAVYQQDGQEQP